MPSVRAGRRALRGLDRGSRALDRRPDRSERRGSSTGSAAAHAIAAKTSIGRNHEGELVMLAASVSREHAELSKTDAGWHIRDLGSRNGTFVDGARAQGRVPLAGADDDQDRRRRAVVPRRGRRTSRSRAPSMATASGGGGLVRYNISPGQRRAVPRRHHRPRRPAARSCRARRAPTSWTERGLAPLEYQLLRALCARATEEANSPSAVRGCVADQAARARSPVPVEVRERGERAPGRAPASHRARRDRGRRRARGRAGARLLPRVPGQRRFDRSTMIL